MKPATQARIDAVLTAMFTYAHIGEVSEEDIREAIRLALLEQDRDTRHACAEAVSAVYTGELVMSKAEIVHAAHQACMNARTV